MCTIPRIDSAALLNCWRKLESGGSSMKAAPVFEDEQARFSLRLDRQTIEWIIDLEFPAGGPEPRILKSLKFIRVEEEMRSTKMSKRRLLSVRYSPRDNDCLAIWPHFAETILSQCGITATETHCAQEVFRAFEEWRKFWPGKRKFGTDQVLGLFGELSFLKRLLNEFTPAVAIDSWHGPNARDHDFGLRRLALEVKTGAGRTNTIKIANLDQLNDSGLEALYLVHGCLRATDDPNFSLQKLGDDIRTGLSKEVLAKFEIKLRNARWFKATQQQRDATCFRVAEWKLYRVVEGFPRLLKQNVEKFGPGLDVQKYTVDLRFCTQFELKTSELSELWQLLRQP